MLLSSETPEFYKDGASTFMGVVGVAVLLLFVVFLYLNKRLCLYSSSSNSTDIGLSHEVAPDQTPKDNLHEGALVHTCLSSSLQWSSRGRGTRGKGYYLDRRGESCQACLGCSEQSGSSGGGGGGGGRLRGSPSKAGSNRGSSRSDDRRAAMGLGGSLQPHEQGGLSSSSERGEYLSKRASPHQEQQCSPLLSHLSQHLSSGHHSTSNQHHHSTSHHSSGHHSYGHHNTHGDQYYSLERCASTGSPARPPKGSLQYPHYSSLQSNHSTSRPANLNDLRASSVNLNQQQHHHVNFMNNNGDEVSSHSNLNHHALNHHQDYHSGSAGGRREHINNAEHLLGAEHGDLCPCDGSPGRDLASLAETGRVGSPASNPSRLRRHHLDNDNASTLLQDAALPPGVTQPGTSGAGITEVAGSSSASSSGSTTSCDDNLLAHRSLRHRDTNGGRGLGDPNRSPYMQVLGEHNRSPHMQARDDGMLPRCCGSLEVGFAYDHPTRILTTHILQARDVPDRDNGGASNSQVRLTLVPGRRQKHKTRIRPSTTPQFNEAFIFRKINPEELSGIRLRLRLYGCERMRRERLIGEVLVPLSTVNLTMANTLWLMLEHHSHAMSAAEDLAEVCSLPRSDSTGSNHSTHGAAPGLLLGLTYNGTTGRLAVEVIKGSHFRTSEDAGGGGSGNPRAPDSLVKIRLTSSSGQEIATAKTTIRRGQPNPLFKETFMFQVALFQLPDVSLLVSVFAKKSMKRKDMIGWFSLGLNSSGEEELAHWNQMRDSKGGQTCCWHSLLVA